MQRVLGLAIFATVVLLSCAAEATELRELIQELLDEKENERERHITIVKAIETVDRGTKYAEDTKTMIGGIEGDELKSTLKPICKKFVREVFGKTFITVKGSLFSAKSNVDFYIKKNGQDGGKRLTNILRELLSDVEKEEKRSDTAVKPGKLMQDIIKDIKAVNKEFLYNLGAHENLEQDRKDLLALIASVGDLGKKAGQLKKECIKARVFFLTQV